MATVTIDVMRKCYHPAVSFDRTLPSLKGELSYYLLKHITRLPSDLKRPRSWFPRLRIGTNTPASLDRRYAFDTATAKQV